MRIRLFRSSPENPSTNLSNPAEWLTSAFGHKSHSGVSVTPDSVLGIPAVYSAVRVLSETVASLPIGVYVKDGAGAMRADHPANLILAEPNGVMTWFEFADVMMIHLGLWGNFYARIEMSYVRPTGLEVIHPSKCEPVEQGGEIFYKIEGEKELVPAREMIHVKGLSFDGIKGKSPVTMLRESFGLGLASQEFGANYFGQGINPGGVVSVEGVLEDAAYTRMLNSFNAAYGGLGNAHKAVLLEQGAKFTPAVKTALADAQFVEARGFQVSEAARIFRIPPHMIGDLDRSTHSNIEHQGIEFVKYSLLPWLKRIESEFNRKLLWETEKSTHYFRFNVEGLLRGDSAARAELYKSLFSVGAISQNEIRALENMNPIDGGDRYFIPTNNYTPIDRIDDVIGAQTGTE